MSVLTGKELRIVGFLCNWCSYGGADTAGVARATQPTDLRIIRVPCSGRVNPLFPLKALLSGADGVLVSGCHPRDCHYSAGNFYARRRLELLKEFLPIIGINPDRFEYTWVSASEGQRWQQVVTAFTHRIHKLGPAPRFKDAEPIYELPSALTAPVRPLDCGGNPALDELKQQIREALADGHLHCVVGWQQGYDAIHATPLHMRKPEDVDRLIWGPFNIHSTANMITQLIKEAQDAAMVGVKRGDPIPPAKKVGVVVKGCDSKGLVELLQEKLIERDAVEIFAMGCNGTVSTDRILAKIGAAARVSAVSGQGDTLTVTTADGTEHALSMSDIAQDKCRLCKMPSAKVYDHFAGEPVTVAEDAVPEPAAIMAYLDSLTLDQRMGFWKGQMERCIRCHACRNACPMCVCREVCVADSREPHWVTQDDTVTNKFFFQLIHALHLAGRCTGCGECNRACPVGIPVGALKMQTGRIVQRLFDGYQPGTNADAIPPFLGYEVEEKNIPEHHIERA